MCCLKEVNRIQEKVLNRLAKIWVDNYQNVSGRNYVGSRHEMGEILGKFREEREVMY